MHDAIPDSELNDYRRRLGDAAFATRIRFENGENPIFSGAFRRRHLFGPLTPLVIRTGRLLLRLSGLTPLGRRRFHAVRVIRHPVVIPSLPQPFDGYRILHLSDLHIDLDPTFADTLIRCLEGLAYDLCILTGDYRNHTYGSCEAAVSGMLRLLPALRRPCFAVLGNHDRLGMVGPLEAAGCRFLLNERVSIEKAGAVLSLAGVDDPCVVGAHSLEHALTGAPAGEMRLLLAHSPTIHREAARHGVAYVFAGHTHGGQVCLPGGYIPFPNDPSPRAMHRGPWSVDGVQGYTSPGTGACGIAVRFNCPPEATLHILRRAPGEQT